MQGLPKLSQSREKRKPPAACPSPLFTACLICPFSILGLDLRFTGHTAGSDTSCAAFQKQARGRPDKKTPYRTQFKEFRPYKLCGNCIAQCLPGNCEEHPGRGRDILRTETTSCLLMGQRDRAHILAGGAAELPGFALTSVGKTASSSLYAKGMGRS